MKHAPNPWELFEPTSEYARASIAAMHRIRQIGYQPWLAEELREPSHRDPVWLQFVLSEGERLGVEPAPKEKP